MPKAARIGDPINCGDSISTGSPNVLINGLPAARLGDVTCGHCFSSIDIIEGASTVLVNNIPVSYIGHSIATHCCGPACHSGQISDGSQNVIIEG